MKTLTPDELHTLLDASDEVQLVDVLSSEHYTKVHLPGAQNLPLNELSERATDALDADRPVVVYCSGPDCSMSPKAAQMLDDLGFTDVYDFEGGIVEWRRSGRPVVRSKNEADHDT